MEQLGCKEQPLGSLAEAGRESFGSHKGHWPLLLIRYLD